MISMEAFTSIRIQTTDLLNYLKGQNPFVKVILPYPNLTPINLRQCRASKYRSKRTNPMNHEKKYYKTILTSIF